nr:MAG TPA: hypothetical protein [Caudoviricetes sp.]
MDEDKFNALANAYRAMYLSSKDNKELKENINKFRAGYIDIPQKNKQLNNKGNDSN